MALAETVVEVTADTDPFERQLRAGLRAEAASAGRALDDGLKRATQRTGDDIGRRIARDVNSRLRDERGRLVAAGRSAGDAAGRSFSDSFRNALGFQAATTALTAALAPLRGLLGGLGFVTLATQAAAAANALLSLGAAVAPAAGIIAAFPGAAAVAAAGLLTLRVALSGVGDAFKAAASGDAAKFEESLQGLAPAAQSVAREFFNLQPALQTFRNTVQDAFFSQFVGQLTETANVLAGPLSQAMAFVAAESGKAVTAFAQFAKEGATVAFLQNLFAATGVSVANFASALQPVLAGFRDLAGVALPLMGQLSGSIANAAASFGQFLSNAVASGQATAWIENALTVLRQLGFVAQQVGGIIEAVFRAAGQSGGDALGVIGNLLLSINQFLTSAQGQTALVNLFEALGAIGGQLGNIFGALGTQIGNLAPIIGNIVQALGPAVQTAVTALGEGLTALGPALVPIAQGIADAFSAIAPALAPLGSAIGQVLSALAPVLPVLGQLIQLVATNLSTAFSALAAVIAPVVQALADSLAPIFPQLIAVANQLAPIFAQLATVIGGALGSALQQLLPPILAILPQLVSGLVPAIQQLANVFIELVPAMAPVVTEMVSSLLPVLPALVPLVLELVNAFVAITAVAIKLQAPLLKLVAVIVSFLAQESIIPHIQRISSVLTALLKPVTSVANFFGNLASAIGGIDWSTIASAIGGFVTSVAGFFLALPGRILSALAALPGLLLQFWSSVLSLAYEAIVTGVAGVVNLFITLPGLVMEAIAALPGLIIEFFTGLWNVAVELTTTGLNSLISFVSELPGQIFSVISALPGELVEFFSSMWRNISDTVSNGITAVVNLISNMPGKIANFIGNFIDAGRDLINGLLDGLRDMSSGALDDLGRKIVDVVKDGINSGIRFINSFIRDVNAQIPGGDPIPRIPLLAHGAIVDKPTLAMVGEAGKEVVIPLTRPARAQQLAEESGLLRLLSSRGNSSRGPVTSERQPNVTNNFHVHTPATNPEIIANQIMGQLARACR